MKPLRTADKYRELATVHAKYGDNEEAKNHRALARQFDRLDAVPCEHVWQRIRVVRGRAHEVCARNGCKQIVSDATL